MWWMANCQTQRCQSFPATKLSDGLMRSGLAWRDLKLGERVGIPWLGHTCGVCPYCRNDQENLCDHPLFTGYTRDGGFATATIADARFAFPLGEAGSDEALAPLLCAGLIGWRSLVIAGKGKIWGFMALAPPPISSRRWLSGRAGRFLRLRGREIQNRSPLPGALV